MKLDEWLFQKKIKQKKIAKDLQLNPQTICNLINKSRTVKLRTALAIYRYTKGQVELEELLSQEDFEYVTTVQSYDHFKDKS